jgi:uncharacterized membrane protein
MIQKPHRVALYRQITWWAFAFPIVMIVALAIHSLYLLNWIHVLSGALWTGADLFLGFILGPVMRRLELSQRAAVVAYLVPRTFLYFPMVSLTAGTAGWYLAGWIGLLERSNPQFPWVVAALILVTLLTVQGLFVILPNSVRIWLELQREAPDRERIVRINRVNIVLAGVQGVMQVAIIVVMAHFALV